MGGKKSQRKGAAGERELAAILQEHGYDCTRGGSLSFGEVPDLSGLPGIHIEVKRADAGRYARSVPPAEPEAIQKAKAEQAADHELFFSALDLMSQCANLLNRNEKK